MKHLGKVLRISLISLFVFTVGCTNVMFKISGRGALPILLNNPPAKVEVIRHISISKIRKFDRTGAIDVSEILQDYFARTDADALINTTITVKNDFATNCLNIVTFGMANASRIVIDGDLVKAPNGLGLLDLPGAKIMLCSKNLGELMERAADSGLLNTSANQMIVKNKGKFLLIRFNQNTPYKSQYN